MVLDDSLGDSLQRIDIGLDRLAADMGWEVASHRLARLRQSGAHSASRHPRGVRPRRGCRGCRPYSVAERPRCGTAALWHGRGAADTAHDWNRRFHEAIHLMAHSRIMAETTRRMWDLSDFLINTTGSPDPLSPALDERHEDHERIRAALHAGDQQTARAEMESHIVRTMTSSRTSSTSAGRPDPARCRLSTDGASDGGAAPAPQPRWSRRRRRWTPRRVSFWTAVRVWSSCSTGGTCPLPSMTTPWLSGSSARHSSR